MPQSTTKKKSKPAVNNGEKINAQTVTAKLPVPDKKQDVKIVRFTATRIALLSLLGFLLVAASVVSVIALTYSRIYPNLSAYDVELGGMTQAEAAAALSKKLESVYSGKSITVSLDNRSVEISAEQARVSLSAEKTAQSAFEAGRSGNIFSRLSFAISSLFSQRVVESGNDFYIDREAVRKIVGNLSDEMEVSAVEYRWTIGDSSIEVSGGQTGFRSDPDRITDDVVNNFETLNFSPLAYQSEPLPPTPFPLEELYEQITVEPVSAYVTLEDKSTAKLMPHSNGVSFDKQQAQTIMSQNPDRFSIPFVYTTPDLTLEELEANLFRDLLGQYSTSTATSSENRATNIELSAQAMNDTILLPGDEFSFNNIVGQRTEERGYKIAGAYINGQLADSLGGGICQSSSTLYNAALYANLKIVNRLCHSMTVSYVPLGQDATVDWGNIDFVFANDTAYPIRILAYHVNRKLTVQIWGTKTDNLTVSIEYEKSGYKPSETIIVENPELAPGTKHTKQTGYDGWTVQTYRVVKDPDGNVVYRNPESKSVYRKVDSIIEVGPGSASGGDIPTDNPLPSEPQESPQDDPAQEPDLPSETPAEPQEPEVPEI